MRFKGQEKTPGRPRKCRDDLSAVWEYLSVLLEELEEDKEGLVMQ